MYFNNPFVSLKNWSNICISMHLMLRIYCRLHHWVKACFINLLSWRNVFWFYMICIW